MSTTAELVLVCFFAVPALIFIGFCHWWFRAFPDVPLMKLTNYAPSIRSPYFGRLDFGTTSFLTVTATAHVPVTYVS